MTDRLHIPKPVRIVLLLIPIFLFLPKVSLADQFKVTRVYDGDTVKAEGQDIAIKVRLVGIDAPETCRKKGEPHQPYSQQAIKYLAGFVLNKTVDIKGYGLDRYGLNLGVIHLDGNDINLEMVKAGMAEVYRGFAPHRFNLAPYWQAEKEAHEAGKGMWAQGEKYVSPKTWRRTHRGK
jgi:endonuclease YncB( thermonuclease family)